MSVGQTSESDREGARRPRVCGRPRKRRAERSVAVSTGENSSKDLATDCALSLSPASSDHDDQIDSRSDSESLDSGDSQATMSAEGIALCLLRDFRDKPLPKASDLIWLVSEHEVPQQ